MSAVLDMVGVVCWLLITFGLLALVEKWAHHDADPEHRSSRYGDRW